MIFRSLSCSILCALVPWGLLCAQKIQPADEGTVQLSLGDDVEVKVLVDAISDHLGVNIIYDEQLLHKTVTIKSPAKIPRESLLPLLQSALRIKQLALVDADVPGWKQIVETKSLPSSARQGEADAVVKQSGGAAAVTQLFTLQHALASQVDQSIKPFLSVDGGNSLALNELRVIIVTDYASNVQKVAQLVELIDSPRPATVKRLVPLEQADASLLAPQVTKLVASGSTTQGASGQAAGTPRLEVAYDTRTNQLILIGPEADVEELVQFVKQLDKPIESLTKVYRFDYVTPDRVDALVQQLMGEDARPAKYKSAMDEEGQLLFVTGTPETHKQVESVKELLDVSTSQPSSPIRFYRLENVNAADILDTLLNIRDDTERSPRGERSDQRGIRRIESEHRLWPSDSPSLPPPPNVLYRGQASGTAAEMAAATSLTPRTGGEARISADLSTNSLVIIAEPAVQEFYAEVISKLDRARPQVLLEAKLVILNAADDFSLGVEASGGDRSGLKRLFAFTQFGLSKVDPISGVLTIIPGTGANGTLVDPDVADVVVRALTTCKRARVLSAPRVLVNDNETGLLTSVREEPFVSVNASNVVATTSFAGFAEAGTTISVTPHIAQDGKLRLEYKVTLNSFTGEASEGVPPPRQTDELESIVTIPDGHTVIVGGLTLESDSHEVDSVPLLGSIPILKHLFSLDQRNGKKSTLFVFLKPIILRDDKFRDLKFLSDRDLTCAIPPGRFPLSQPMIMNPATGCHAEARITDERLYPDWVPADPPVPLLLREPATTGPDTLP